MVSGRSQGSRNPKQDGSSSLRIGGSHSSSNNNNNVNSYSGGESNQNDGTNRNCGQIQRLQGMESPQHSQHLHHRPIQHIPNNQRDISAQHQHPLQSQHQHLQSVTTTLPASFEPNRNCQYNTIMQQLQPFTAAAPQPSQSESGPLHLDGNLIGYHAAAGIVATTRQPTPPNVGARGASPLYLGGHNQQASFLDSSSRPNSNCITFNSSNDKSTSPIPLMGQTSNRNSRQKDGVTGSSISPLNAGYYPHGQQRLQQVKFDMLQHTMNQNMPKLPARDSPNGTQRLSPSSPNSTNIMAFAKINQRLSPTPNNASSFRISVGPNNSSLNYSGKRKLSGSESSNQQSQQHQSNHQNQINAKRPRKGGETIHIKNFGKEEVVAQLKIHLMEIYKTIWTDVFQIADFVNKHPDLNDKKYEQSKNQFLKMVHDLRNKSKFMIIRTKLREGDFSTIAIINAIENECGFLLHVLGQISQYFYTNFSMVKSLIEKVSCVGNLQDKTREKIRQIDILRKGVAIMAQNGELQKNSVNSNVSNETNNAKEENAAPKMSSSPPVDRRPSSDKISPSPPVDRRPSSDKISPSPTVDKPSSDKMSPSPTVGKPLATTGPPRSSSTKKKRKKSKVRVVDDENDNIFKGNGSNGRRKGKHSQNSLILEDTVKSATTSSDLSKKASVPTVRIKDAEPNRITNPLLEMPNCQSVPKASVTQGSFPYENMPQGSEFWKIMPLYFPTQDTYPISYYSKILGFDASLANKSIEMSNNTESIDIEFIKSMQLQECKDDLWDELPTPGSFSRHLSTLQDSKMIESPLQDIDPMWKAIFEQYRGFQHDEYKPSPDIKKENVIFHDCVDYARKLKLLDESVQFRQANTADIAALDKFSPQNKTDDSNVVDFYNAMRCGSQFIIVCESKEQGILGYVHYNFCWFRQKVENYAVKFDLAPNMGGAVNFLSNARGKKNMAERIVHIENVQTRKDIKNLNSSTTDLILTALALEHARQHVVYGVMDTKKASVSFFKKYFRMEEIATNDGEENCVFLAIDLEKCNYRFALLKKDRESNLEDVGTNTCTKYERMLVALPSMQEVIGVSIDNTAGKVVFKVHKDDMSQSCPLGRNNTTMKISLKMRKSDSSVLKISKNVTDSKNDKASHRGKFDLTKSDWNFLRSFQVSNPKSLDLSQNNCPTVTTEIDSLHKELKEAESEVLPTLWSLYKNVYEERMTFEVKSVERSQQRLILKQYNDMLLCRRKMQEAMERQQEEEENAVCDICYDGESTGENRIIFCDSCDISVHQGCYGIEKVPSGDWFCHACLYFKRDNHSKTNDDEYPAKPQQKNQKSAKLPIVCEICPRRQGAFIQTWKKDVDLKKRGLSPSWVHVVCAKWHGLGFVDTSSGEEIPYGDIVDDVSLLTSFHKENDHQCFLCKGKRGCYVKCIECDTWMHITCARTSGLCNFIHGSNHLGEVKSEEVWTVKCPQHSSFDDPDHKPSGTAHLVALAKKFPSEPKPPPPPPPPPKPKPFYKMTKRERERNLKDPKFEKDVTDMIMTKINSRRCEVCFLPPNDREDGLLQCNMCDSVAHELCLSQKWHHERPRNKAPITFCTRCVWVKDNSEKEDFIQPECHMCNSKVGTLEKAEATPSSNKLKKRNQTAYKKSYFGRQIWVHSTCAMWHSKCIVNEHGVFDCSAIIMANGSSHIGSKTKCSLCGRYDKIKFQCSHVDECSGEKNCPFHFHLTCARQAGLEVADVEIRGEGLNQTSFDVKCFQHARCHYALRAVLEDMIEIEKTKPTNGSMSIERAAKTFNWGVIALRCLGWAWQWSDWWVQIGDTWEPLLEVNQKEENMSKEELKIIDSDRESRCSDARKCRLAAFGAALRNRDYDNDEGDDRLPLERALRAVLSIPSLVGPLNEDEINFFVQWLGLVYRSKHPELGFGDHAIPVNEEYENGSSTFFHNKSPKFVLGERSLPGKQVLKDGQIFETNITEIDDFCPEEMPLNIFLRSPEKLHMHGKQSKKKWKSLTASGKEEEKSTSATTGHSEPGKSNAQIVRSRGRRKL